jgi:hypothetical protein
MTGGILSAVIPEFWDCPAVWPRSRWRAGSAGSIGTTGHDRSPALRPPFHRTHVAALASQSWMDRADLAIPDSASGPRTEGMTRRVEDLLDATLRRL